ncbi:hypothetical protein E8E11_011966 [Didymella keratinophila]|nr:hypothetical protein E8E11_011966 [Didymella keratinophila]
MVGALVSVFGSALQAGAVNMAMLIVGRFIGGVAVGQLTSTAPLYAAELSEAKYRGVLSGLLQWMMSRGFLWPNGRAMYIPSTALNSHGRRFPPAFQCFPGLILISGIFFLQESPRWLMERDRHEEAISSLQKLRRGYDSEVIDFE